jgi:hypothetical protein
MKNSDNQNLRLPDGNPELQTKPASTRSAQKPIRSDWQTTESMDKWRILMVDLVYALNSAFRDVFYWQGVKTEKDSCGEIVRILHKLNQLPDHDRTVRIMHRGSPGTKLSQKADYIIKLGEFTVDIAAINGVIKRMGLRAKHYEGRLIKSFEQLANQGIDTAFIKIPDESEQGLETMRISLHIVSSYNQAVENEAAIEYVSDTKHFSIQPVLDENYQPDPNLTQLAVLNDLSSENMQQMIQKLSALMKRPEFIRSANRPVNVYQTIFHVKHFKDKLIRPLIEINSTKGAAIDEGQAPAAGGSVRGGPGPAAATEDMRSDQGVSNDAVSPDQAPAVGNADVGAVPANEPDPVAMKSRVAGFVKQTYGHAPGSALQAMKTIYSKDYGQLDLQGLEDRLQQISDLLAVVESSDPSGEIVSEVRRRIQEGMDQVPNDVLGDVIVQEDFLKVWDGEEEKILGKANDDLLTIIDSSRERTASRKNTRRSQQRDAHISEQDHEELAETFNISIHESKEVIKFFKACFDHQKNFQRALFEKNIPNFAGYPKRIFEILWEFLWETPHRKDRLPFLNSLQLLVSEIGQPKQALKVLISDFVLNPTEIRYPDRNALMLAIQFLRTYNKEINTDIEITPEEVLLVQVGLDKSIVRYAAWKINGEHKKIVQKIAAIRKKLLISLKMESSDEQVMPVRFLMALERELHIFLALVGGNTAAEILRDALDYYGNPESGIYQSEESRQHTSSLLQHLAVLIRAVGRVGQQADVGLLDSIKDREQAFLEFSDTPRHAAQVRRNMGWIDAAKAEINSREA